MLPWCLHFEYNVVFFPFRYLYLKYLYHFDSTFILLPSLLPSLLSLLFIHWPNYNVSTSIYILSTMCILIQWVLPLWILVHYLSWFFSWICTHSRIDPVILHLREIKNSSQTLHLVQKCIVLHNVNSVSSILTVWCHSWHRSVSLLVMST